MYMKKILLILSFLVFCFSISIPSDNLDIKDHYVIEKFWQDIKDLPINKRPKVALVLGGGGARGFAHVGVLKVLHEQGVPIDVIVGTSVGALVGSLYAGGLSIDEIYSIVEKVKWRDLTAFSFSSVIDFVLFNNFIKTDKMQEFISGAIDNKRFDELKIPFACVATDINTGERIILREGFVAPAVRASASIPGLFKPVEYRHRFLVDGGVTNNVPVDVARMLGADIVIAVVLQKDYTTNKIDTVYRIMRQVIDIQSSIINESKLESADIVINPKIEGVDMLDLKQRKIVLNMGEIEAQKDIFKIKTFLVNRFFENIVEFYKEGNNKK